MGHFHVFRVQNCIKKAENLQLHYQRKCELIGVTNLHADVMHRSALRERDGLTFGQCL